MTEAEYRALPIDSYSSLKLFSEDRRKYYKKFVLGEPVREEDTPSLTTGSLVDCLLLAPSEFDSRYVLSVSQVPSGQYGKFVEELMKVTLINTDENGEVTKEVEDMIEDAYNAVKFDRNGNIVDFKRDSLDTVKRKFLGTELEMYYRQLRESHGKTVIELSTLETAQAIVNELKTNFVTKDIVNLRTEEFIIVFNQFPIIGELSSTITQSVPFPLKCLVDKLVIDHKNKEIFPYDLKTTWDNENEFVANYFKYKYYIQASVYFYLIVEWKKKQSSLDNYTVHYPRFIVADSYNYKNPLIYKTTKQNFEQGMRGFLLKGRYHQGVVSIIKDIMWHREMGIWNISRKNYINNGIIEITPFES